MAPASSVVARLKNLFKRLSLWRNKKTTTPGKPAAVSDKASLPAQSKAVSEQPIKPQDRSAVKTASTMPTLQIALQNSTNSNQVYAYISEEPIIMIIQVMKTELTRSSRSSHRQQQLSVPLVGRCQNAVLPAFATFHWTEA